MQAVHRSEAPLPERFLAALLLTTALVLPALFLPSMEDSFALPKITFLRFAFGLSVAALAWALLTVRSARVLPPFVRYALLAFVITNFVAFAFSSDMRRSLLGDYWHHQGVTTAVIYAGSLYMAALIFRTPHAVRLLFVVVVLSAVPVSFYAMAQFLERDPIDWGLGPGRPWRIFSTFGQPNALAAYEVMVIPIAIHLLYGANRWARLGIGGVLSLAVVALVLTLSRAGYLALLIALPLAVAPFLVDRATLKRIGLLAAAISIAALSVISVNPLGETSANAKDRLTALQDLNDWSLQGHLGMWETAAEITLDDPLLGAGQDTYSVLFARNRDPDLRGFENMLPAQPVDPHNHYLSLAVSTGLPSLALYLALVSACILLAVRSIRSGSAWKRPALLALLAAILAHLVTDLFTTADVTTNWLFWVFMGATIGVACAAERPDETPALAPQPRIGRVSPKLWIRPIAFAVLAVAGMTAAVLALVPLSAEIVAGQGARRAAVGDWWAAAERFDQAAALNPLESRYLVRAGDAYLHGGDGYEALIRYELVHRRFATEALSQEPLPLITGFIYPIEGACLPASDELLPNAPRPARAGIHEGVDFSPGQACANVEMGTPVMAVASGIVTRANHDYVEMTFEGRNDLFSRSRKEGGTDKVTLDRFRGRQVWIDHGGGIVTRYAHLSSIEAGVEFGTTVEAGQVIGYVGNSGNASTFAVEAPSHEDNSQPPDAAALSATGAHLHFEIRIDSSHLGAGLPPNQARALLARAFSRRYR